MRRLGFAKRLLAGATAMLVALTCFSPAVTLAGEQLGQTDFDDGVGLPWHIVESEPAEMEFELKDGRYYITIVNPGGASKGGEDRWDCQFRHRGLKIVAGHQYHVHYEITASNSGKYYTKIGNLDGTVEIWHNMSNGYDLDSTWDPIQISANQTKVVDLTFTAASGMEVAEWAFHLGGDGQYTPGGCFPAGTEIYFDNMSLEDLTNDENDYVAAEAWTRSGVLTNQVGYFSGADKIATLLCDSGSGVSFELIDESGKSVYEGTSEVFGYDSDSGDTVHKLDFSDFNTAGTYHIETSNGQSSRTFAIDDNKSYSALLYDALNYFYQNRSGIAIEAKYITSSNASSLARAAGHSSDVASIVTDWNNVNATSGTQDVTGGWYDAGDHGKYVVNGGISLWMLQNLYEMSKFSGYEDAFADGTMSIPENNNGYPDLLDEARYEMEWMFKMLVQSGSYKDMVYHKVHDAAWTGLALAPADDEESRVIMPPTTAATLNVAACAAQAARLWKGIDDSFASECLDIAKRTYAAAKANPSVYAPLESPTGGGAYGDDDVTDEFYWAACELYITTGDKTYFSDMESSKFFLQALTTLDGGEAAGLCGSFDWGHTATLGTLSISINKDAVGSSDYSTAVKNIKSAADYFIGVEDNTGYNLPYQSSQIAYNDTDNGYVWGSNSFVVDNSIVMAYAAVLDDSKDYYNGAVSGMDYILGRNPMDYSYVTGYGTHAVMYPHHRWWSNLLDAAFPLAPSGVLVGGPNSGMQDPWVQGSGWKKGTIAPAKCYMDHIEAWSVNECTINWNSPAAWLSAYLLSSTDEGIIVGSTGSGNGITVEQPKENEAATDITEPAEYSQSDNNNKTSDKNNTSDKSDSSDNSSGNSSSDKAKSSDDDDESTSDNSGNQKMIFAIVIVVLVFIFLIVTEIMIYKVIKLKNQSKKDE